MNRRKSILGLAVLLALCAVSGSPGGPKSPPKDPARKTSAWTLKEALAALKLSPHDTYLQYVVLQLARREKKLPEVAEEVDRLVFGDGPAREGRRGQVDLFSLFTGALAVQESLQLDTMRGERTQPRTRWTMEKVTRYKDVEVTVEKNGKTERVVKKTPYTVTRPVPVTVVEGAPREAQEKRRKERVELRKLQGPDVQSHPWEKMLAGKKPAVSPLARSVPDDYYLVEFHSLTKLLDVADLNNLWGQYLFNQGAQDASSSRLAERLRTQLALETNPALRPFYDLVVDGVALTGSDLYLREGSDLTVLFHLKQPDMFRRRMEDFARNVQKARPGVRRTTGTYLGVDYVHLASADREVNVYAADPAPDLHVRGNSKVAFERVLAAIRGRGPDGKPVRRLGDTAEFRYIRTLMPAGAREEDGFIYLSDPFIRRLVGPQVKLTERRRLLCFNHLKMISHAALLYRTEHGKAPASLEELARAKCCPGRFNKGKLVCPCGGKYTLAPDGLTGVCSHHGTSHFLTPCCEIPLKEVNGLEADEYEDFRKDYNQYWKTYFDPIALRVQVTPRRYRVETIVLPLIDNSVYTAMASYLGGKPEPLDALPVPRKNVFSLGLHFNKKRLLKDAERWVKELVRPDEAPKAVPFVPALAAEEGGGLPAPKDPLVEALRQAGVPAREANRVSWKRVKKFLSEGLGDQVGLHLYDFSPPIEIELPSLFGEMLGGHITSDDLEEGAEVLFTVLLNSGVFPAGYVSFPIKDPQVVEKFLEDLDRPLARIARKVKGRFAWDLSGDFYTFRLRTNQKVRSLGFRFGVVKFRFFWCRIGNGLYITNESFILKDLAALEAARNEKKNAPDQDSVGHAMVRLRPENWNLLRGKNRLSWAENNREACLNNLGPLSNVARSQAAGKSPEESGRAALKLAARVYGLHFFCPEGGHYLVAADGRTCECSVHGSPLEPRQPMAPNKDGPFGKVTADLKTVTATLTFREDGLHAVLTIDRK